MLKPLLFLPGPMQVPEFVQTAGERPLFSHRSPQMMDLLARTVRIAEVEWRTGAGVDDIQNALAPWPNAQTVFITRCLS